MEIRRTLNAVCTRLVRLEIITGTEYKHEETIDQINECKSTVFTQFTEKKKVPENWFHKQNDGRKNTVYVLWLSNFVDLKK